MITTVSECGHVRIPGSGRRDGNYFLSAALAGERVGLREVADDAWQVSFMSLELGVIDLAARKFVLGTGREGTSDEKDRD
jgi:hypothetical protein